MHWSGCGKATLTRLVTRESERNSRRPPFTKFDQSRWTYTLSTQAKQPIDKHPTYSKSEECLILAGLQRYQAGDVQTGWGRG